MKHQKYSIEEILFLLSFVKPNAPIPDYQQCEQEIEPMYRQKFGISRSGGSLYMVIWRIANGYYDKKIA